jgi:hypothetical protein
MNTTKLLSRANTLCVLALIGCSAAYAQGQWGLEAGYNFKREAAMLGGRFVAPVNPNFDLVPQLAVDFKIDELVLDVDAHILNPGTSLYFLTGLNYANDDAGLNLGAGLAVDLTKTTKGFLELKYVAFGWKGTIFKGGVLF